MRVVRDEVAVVEVVVVLLVGVVVESGDGGGCVAYSCTMASNRLTLPPACKSWILRQTAWVAADTTQNLLFSIFGVSPFRQ